MITIIDYGAGNIGSVLNMIRHVGGYAAVAKSAGDVLRAKKIILPGVGSFDNAMARLVGLGLIAPLKERASAGIPVLGICLGMQLLADSSEEGSMVGLGLIPGRVRRFHFTGDAESLKIPHMGWNHVRPLRASPLVKDLGDAARFYFVHSYHFDCDCRDDAILSSEYGYEFTSGVQRGRIMGVQFHPEKSHRYGMQLIRNFVEI